MIHKNRASTATLLAALLAAWSADAGAEPPMKTPVGQSPSIKPPSVSAPLIKSTMMSHVADTLQPMTKGRAVSAGGISWQCHGSRCQGSGVSKAPSVDTCRALAAQVGALRSFSFGKQALDADGLAQCNAGRIATREKAPAPGTFNQMQKHMLGPKATGTQPDRSIEAEVWPAPKAAGAAPKTKPIPTMPVSGFAAKIQPAPSPSAGAPSIPTMAPKLLATPKRAPGGFAPKTPASAMPADAPAAPRTYPVSVRTVALTVTGTGQRELATEAEQRAAFRPLAVRTAVLTVTGTGIRESEEEARLRAEFVPKTVRTPALTVTGTGTRQ